MSATSGRSQRYLGDQCPPRFQPPCPGLWKRVLSALLVIVLGILVWPAGSALAHAQPVRANPPINGTVPTAPSTLEVWFSEEVDTKDVRLSVKGPDGSVVDQGDTAVDLFDPQRVHVTVSLKPGLGPGNYVVSWHTLSALDGDAADGFFSFFIESGTPSASPVASPAAATPAATPTTAAAAVAVGPTATVVPIPPDDSNFDSRAFGLAVLAGIVVAIGIYLFWRLVRPKPGSGAPPE